MEVSKGVIIWMVVYVCGVPTTSGRYPGKPVQASGTHDYQAMVEYSIQAELLGMQGEIQNRDLRLQNTELGRTYSMSGSGSFSSVTIAPMVERIAKINTRHTPLATIPPL